MNIHGRDEPLCSLESPRENCYDELMRKQAFDRFSIAERCLIAVDIIIGRLLRYSIYPSVTATPAFGFVGVYPRSNGLKSKQALFPAPSFDILKQLFNNKPLNGLRGVLIAVSSVLRELQSRVCCNDFASLTRKTRDRNFLRFVVIISAR